MELAGKYATGYTPDMFPDQILMQQEANQTTDPGLRSALLEFQYPFSRTDLINSTYSPEVKAKILQLVD